MNTLSSPIHADLDQAQQVGLRLRTQLRRGRFNPGERMPTLRELTRRFDTSLNTVQRAIADLTRDGFVETRGRAGTFVTNHPPHLTRFGLAFLYNPSAGPDRWTRFHNALHLEAHSALLPRGRRFVHFHNLIDRQESNPNQLELRQDVASHRLAGLILMGSASLVESVTRVIDPELPRACIDHSGDPEVPAVVIDADAWLRRALTELAQRGRRRIALIQLQAHSTRPQDSTPVDFFLRHVQQAGLTTEPGFCQVNSLSSLLGVAQSVRLLMSLPEDRRPDGLIVSDDNLVEHASQGLVQSGLRAGPGEPIDLIAHANFPHPVNVPMPVVHLGYDVRWMLAKALELLDAQRSVPLAQRPRNHEVVAPVISRDDLHGHINPLLHVPDDPSSTP